MTEPTYFRVKGAPQVFLDSQRRGVEPQEIVPVAVVSPNDDRRIRKIVDEVLGYPDSIDERMDRVSKLLESWTKPVSTKPDEPKGFAAAVRVRDGRRFSRDKYGWWRLEGSGVSRRWDELDVPDEGHILSHGVEGD